MTVYTTQTLVPFLQWGEPSAYYDGGNVFIGNAVPAANYYGGQGAIQTILYDVDALQGNIVIEATLNDLQESAPWFEIARLEANNQSEVRSNTVIGNFTWLRATVTDFTAGNVDIVNAAY
jgi:hypothetical protein